MAITDEQLSDDHDENLRMQNELLRLKLNAETGGDLSVFNELDPSVENEFLKNILAFESSYAGAKRAKIFEILGRPDFKLVDNLDDEAIISELARLTDLLAANNFAIDFSGDYPDRIKYAFITEELFDKEADDLKVPGLTTHFDYEEFHPNHKQDIQNRTQEFISGWFERDIAAFAWCLANQFVLPDGKTFTKAEIKQKLVDLFASYTSFTDCKFIIKDIDFHLNEGTGLGHAEGAVKYLANLENHEDILFNGPFKLYLEYQYGWWSVFYAVFPGLAY